MIASVEITVVYFQYCSDTIELNCIIIVSSKKYPECVRDSTKLENLATFISQDSFSWKKTEA